MKKNIFNIIVSKNYSNYRIDKFLNLQINDLSRTRIQNLIHDHRVKLNNELINNTSKKNKRK